MKKTYYAVCRTYYDDGKVIAMLTDVIEANEKPVNTHKEIRRCDVYVDWFDSLEEAMKYIKEYKRA